jgi:septal ring factor EnvC (AmiA/AmiB activator)
LTPSVQIPDSVLGAAAVAFFAAATLIARSMFSTVKEASRVVNTNATLQETIAALQKTNDTQAECISILEAQVKRLQIDLAAEKERNDELTMRISALEHIIRHGGEP